jgi:hypothetical protein
MYTFLYAFILCMVQKNKYRMPAGFRHFIMNNNIFIIH